MFFIRVIRAIRGCQNALIAVFGFLALASAAHAADNTLTKEELADGWVLLFDGQTDFGWKPTGKANWKVADGVISVSEGEAGFLYHATQFGDFALRVDFRSEKDTNSGVFLRTSPVPKDPTKDCYELNIAAPDVSPFPTGSFVGRKKCEPYVGKPGSWQSFDVTVRGDRLTAKLDGQQVLDYADPRPLGRGYVSLQFNKGKVEFRNIKLRPLGLPSIFNGKDTTGWKVHPAEKNKSVFSVTPDGWLNVRNGPGQLETEGQWADFALQLEVFCDGKSLNSGLFFRNIPGEFWQGYESQIHNGFKDSGSKDGDRTKPVDFGTGAIYRRQPARKVVANDGEWFHKTVIAVGPHMSTWVNGYQVIDWTDKRAKNENARNGLRLEKGTLALQGHDATTDISFRNLRIGELAARGK